MTAEPRAFPGAFMLLFRPALVLSLVFPLSVALAAPLSEQTAIDSALANHPSVAAARAALIAAEGLRDEADYLLPANPAIRVERTTDQYQSNIGNREWLFELSAPLWMPGQRSGRQAVAAARSQEAEADVKTARWALEGAVRDAYWKVWQTSELAKAAEQRLDRTTALRAAAERQVKAREMREFDARTLASEVLADRQTAARRKAEMESGLAVLAELTGLERNALVELEAPHPEAPPRTLLASQESNRPDLQALRSRIDGGQANYDLQQARAIPNPELAFAAKRVSTDFGRTYDDEMVLGIKIPIPVVDRNQREIMAATADIARNRAEYVAAQAKARRELAQAEGNWRAAWRQWQDAGEALALTSDNLALIEKGFRLGEVSAIDVIQEKRRWGESLEAERAAAAAAALAKAAWESAAGITRAAKND